MQKTLQYNYRHLWRKSKCYVPFFVLGLMPYHLLAQGDTTKKLNEVTVSSGTLPVVQTITPSQSISSSDFDRYNAFNVADAVRDFSGVIIKDYGGIGGFKTISVRGLGANHTAVLYDGVEINDAENGQVDLSTLNLNNVQKITLYNGQPPDICMPARSFASASVLSIVTVKPELSAIKPYQITAGIKTGSFGLFNPYLQWQQRINNNWSFIINSYLENANGQYKYKTNTGTGVDSTHTRTNADINAQQVDGALYWAKSDSNKFNLHINYYDSDRGLPGAVILYSASLSRQRLWNRDFFMQAGYERIWKSGFHLLLNTKVSQLFEHYLDPDYLSESGKLEQRFTQRELYQSAALSYHITPNWEVSYAIDGSIANLGEDVSYPNPSFPNPTRFTLLNVLASNLTIGRFHLQTSVLNSNITETVKKNTATQPRNITTPTVMTTYDPVKNSGLELRAFYKYIFRNPTFDELYYQQVGNPNLKPEYTNQFDLGATYRKALSGIFDYIAFTADAYYNIVNNKIVFIPKDTNGGSIENFGKVDIEGLDASVKTQVKFTDSWKGSLALNYSYQQALNVTDPTSSIYLNQLPYTPKNTVAINAGIDNSHLGVYYNQVISSSRYYTNDNLPYDYIPGYSTSDASVVYHFVAKGKPIVLSAGVNNLFNKSYFVVQSYPMPGRSFRISIQITI